jgi:phage protein D
MIRVETLAAAASVLSKKRKSAFFYRPLSLTPPLLVLLRVLSVSRLFFFRLAEYLEHEPARKKAAAEAQRAKLESLERKLGIEGGASSSSNGDTQVAGKKHRFDDTEYLEQSRELVDNVKSAVTAG